jgi:rare lipoprotein A
MPVRRVYHAIVLLLLAAAALPAAARAQDTGGAAAPQPGGGIVTVSDGSFSLATRADALLGKVARFRGTVPREDAGRTLTVERYDDRSAQWLPAATATVASDGTFLARWRTDHIGRLRIRARVDGAPGGAQAASASPELGVTVYKPATATWYGPRFYGRKTACGQRMTRSLLGVAHRTLPCGTQVAVFYKGRSITVPVVDRGPFRARTAWDLTSAAAQALGFTFTDTIGAVRLRSQASR